MVKFFSTTIIFFNLSAFALDPIQENLISKLKGSGWVGQFFTRGLHNKIAIIFLDTLNGNNQLQYLHELGPGDITEVLSLVDSPCTLTPRIFTPPSDNQDGIISVLQCEDDFETEKNLEQQTERSFKLQIPVVFISLEEKNLALIAQIKGETIYYFFTKKDLPKDVLNSTEEMHNWLSQELQ